MNSTNLFLSLLPLAANLVSSDSLANTRQLKIKDLRVIRAEMPSPYESILVMATDEFSSRVTIACSDGFGPLQSTIMVQAQDSSGQIRSWVYSGSDFYCYGS
ncbi:MAG: hypothetical protein N2578_06945, partial [Bdellovibrionaceae bacterium]|nr:hypothetical protein [Pseudobdellovibrionaceae bacterium]